MPNDDRDKLDKGIAPYVKILVEAGIETFESCQGGKGHAYPEPTIRFYGDRSEGFRALAVIIQQQLPINALRRIWTVDEGEPTGPYWEVVFDRPLTPRHARSDKSACKGQQCGD